MRRLLLPATLLVLLAGTAPADAAYLVADPCGDPSQALVRVGTSSVSMNTARTARHDLGDTTLQGLPGGGVRAVLRTCGPIPAPETFTSFWAVSAGLGEGCAVGIELLDGPAGAPERGATLRVSCTTATTSPLGPGTSTTDVLVRPLPASAWSVTADTITWTLTPDLLAGVAPTWTDPAARTRDGQRGTEVGSSVPLFSGSVAANGPGVADEALSTGTFVVPS